MIFCLVTKKTWPADEHNQVFYKDLGRSDVKVGSRKSERGPFSTYPEAYFLSNEQIAGFRIRISDFTISLFST